MLKEVAIFNVQISQVSHCYKKILKNLLTTNLLVNRFNPKSIQIPNRLFPLRFFQTKTVFPREAPIVRLKNRTSDLRVNDVLDVTCQSGPARPATKLQFFINDTPISQAYANLTESVSPIVLDDGEETGDLPKPIDLNSELNSIDYSNDIGGLQAGPQNGLVLFNSTLRLQIRLRQSLLKARKTVNLRCASYVTHLFTKTSEHVFTVVKDEPPADLSRAFSRKKNSFFRNFNRKTFGPFIDNTRSNYAIGELINVTCFTGSSKPPAFLQWFIGNREAPAEYLRVYKPVETKDGGLRSMLGLEFRLTEQFLADQQPTAQTTSTVQPFAESDGRTDTYSTFQDLGDPVDQQANQTIRLANRKREIKLRCSAQLSRIVHVRTRQFSLSSDQSRLEAAQNSASSSSGLLDGLFKFYAILVLFLFAAPCMCFV